MGWDEMRNRLGESRMGWDGEIAQEPQSLIAASPHTKIWLPPPREQRHKRGGGGSQI